MLSYFAPGEIVGARTPGKNDLSGSGIRSTITLSGLYLHRWLAITPERLSSGLLDRWSWTRRLKDAEKESIRGRSKGFSPSEYRQHLNQEGIEPQLVYIYMTAHFGLSHYASASGAVLRL